jgi:hypothetical protein
MIYRHCQVGLLIKSTNGALQQLGKWMTPEKARHSKMLQNSDRSRAAVVPAGQLSDSDASVLCVCERRCGFR